MELRIRIGTRGSPLAMAQTLLVQNQLKALGFHNIEIITVTTTGDRITDKPLYDIGGKGLFAKELEEALFNNQIDCAVHSLKDLEHHLPQGLMIGAVLEREDPRDVFISRDGVGLKEIPAGALVGTCSPRRAALLRQARPDVEICSIRGNVQTRLNKLTSGDVDGTLLALAGLKRLGLESVPSEILSPDDFIPAAGQGAIAIEIRENNHTLLEILSKINHVPTTQCVTAERLVLAGIQGNCRTPVAAYAEIEKDGIVNLRAALEVGGKLRRTQAQGTDLEELADRVVEHLLR